MTSVYKGASGPYAPTSSDGSFVINIGDFMRISILMVGLMIATAAHAELAYYRSEYISGDTRYCVYRNYNGEYVRQITVKDSCLMTIQAN